MGCGSSTAAETTNNEAPVKETPKTSNSQVPEKEKETPKTNNQEIKTNEQNKNSKSNFIDDAIKAHNFFRDKHGTPHVVHAQDLTDYAQKWAEHLAKTNQFEHSDCKHNGGHIGENLAMMYGSNVSNKPAMDYVKMWYDEIKDYPYFGKSPDMDNFMKFGHFTQVVWKDTKEVGIGVAINNDTVVVVGSYRPPGNYNNDYIDNVPPPL